MDKDLRRELDEIQEEIESFRELAEESELVFNGMRDLAERLVPLINEETTAKLIIELETFMEHWALTRHPQKGIFYRMIHVWLDCLDATARLRTPDLLARLKRQRLYDVQAHLASFDNEIRKPLDKDLYDDAPSSRIPDAPDAESSAPDGPSDDEKD